MDEIIQGTRPDAPIWMAFVPKQIKPREALTVIAVSVAPIAIALLMQRPALRQAIAMRTFHTTKIASQKVADFFQLIATKSAQEYQKAQL